jgi:hypothetical protein
MTWNLSPPLRQKQLIREGKRWFPNLQDASKIWSACNAVAGAFLIDVPLHSPTDKSPAKLHSHAVALFFPFHCIFAVQLSISWQLLCILVPLPKRNSLSEIKKKQRIINAHFEKYLTRNTKC